MDTSSEVRSLHKEDSSNNNQVSTALQCRFFILQMAKAILGAVLFHFDVFV